MRFSHTNSLVRTSLPQTADAPPCRVVGGVHSPKEANISLTRKTRRTQRGLNSVAEETFSSEGTEKPSQAFSFAFFAPSRETNLLSKFAPFGECTLVGGAATSHATLCNRAHRFRSTPASRSSTAHSPLVRARLLDQLRRRVSAGARRLRQDHHRSGVGPPARATASVCPTQHRVGLSR